MDCASSMRVRKDDIGQASLGPRRGPARRWTTRRAGPFFKSLKRELVKERSYRTRDEVNKQDIPKYIELYCNRARMHSTLGYMSPVEYERQYAWGPLKESPVYPSRSIEAERFRTENVSIPKPKNQSRKSQRVASQGVAVPTARQKCAKLLTVPTHWLK